MSPLDDADQEDFVGRKRRLGEETRVRVEQVGLNRDDE